MSSYLVAVTPPVAPTIGQPVVFSIKLGGVGPFSFNWGGGDGVGVTTYSADGKTSYYTFTLAAIPNTHQITVDYNDSQDVFQHRYTFPFTPGFAVPPQVIITPTYGTIKTVGSTQVLVSATQYGTYSNTYVWTKQRIRIEGDPNGPYSPTVVQTDVLASGESTYTTPATATGQAWNYSLSVTNSVGNSVSYTNPLLNNFSIYPAEAPFFVLQPANVSVPVNQVTSMSVAALGAVSYQWRSNGNPIANSNSRFWGPPAIDNSLYNGTLIDCVVTNAYGSTTSSTATFTTTAAVYPPPSGSFVYQPAAINVKSGGTANTSAVATGNSSIAYQWKKNGIAIPGATSANFSAPVTATDNGSVLTLDATIGDPTVGFVTITSDPASLTVTPAVGVGVQVNTPITYTAVASTSGLPSDTFVYSWDFDDNTAGFGNTLTHTWTTIGAHTATVTATDTTTNATADAQKTISLVDWAALVWTSTTQKITATTSASQAMLTDLVKVGTKLVNVVDSSVPAACVSFDTATDIRFENTTATAALTGGGASSGFLLTTGPNAGKILVTARGGVNYGFLDPSTLALTLASGSMALQVYNSNTSRRHAKKAISGNLVFYAGSNSGDGWTIQIYDQISDTWAAKSVAGLPAGELVLDIAVINGKVLMVVDNSTTTYVYTIATDTWAAGPVLPGTSFASGITFKFAYKGIYPFLVTRENPGKSCWWDGVSGTFTFGSAYPLASQSAGSSDNSTSILVNTDDGFIFMIGGYNNGNTTQNTKNIVYFPANDSFTVAGNWASLGFPARAEFFNGRFWSCGQNGVLYKTSLG